MKTHWKKLTNPDYLGAYSLDDKSEITLRITKVVRENVIGTGGKIEECTVAYMKNSKPMILNNTNCKVIAKIYGTPFIEDWKNKDVIIYKKVIKAFGEEVEALRIKEVKPLTPTLKEGTDDYKNVIKALQGGNATIAQVKTKFTLTKEMEETLNGFV